MSATINSEQIVTKMIRNWAFTKGECLLGYPQHVDEIHSKDLPLMIINPPEMSIATSDFNRNTILTNSSWTFTAYNKHDTSLIPVTGGELVKNGVNGKTVAIDDVKSACDVISDYLDNQQAASELGASAGDFVNKNLSLRYVV